MANYKNNFPAYDRLTYIQNPGLTEGLYNEFDHAVNLLNHLDDGITKLQDTNAKLSKDKHAYILIIQSVLPTFAGTLFKYFITLVATSLVNVGINLITGGQLKFDWGGIIVIAFGILLSFGVFYSDFKDPRKKVQELETKANISNE